MDPEDVTFPENEKEALDANVTGMDGYVLLCKWRKDRENLTLGYNGTKSSPIRWFKIFLKFFLKILFNESI